MRNVLPLPSVMTWWPQCQLVLRVRDPAMRVCRNQGLVVATADEVLDESSIATTSTSVSELKL